MAETFDRHGNENERVGGSVMNQILRPQDTFRKLNSALVGLGDYVYGYYKSGAHEPFYVGKGRKSRALDHWRDAVKPQKEGEKKQIEIIREMLNSGEQPILRIFAYNLENTSRNEISAVVERTLQNAYVIQEVLDKTLGANRLKNPDGSIYKGALVQKRDDSKHFPSLSLEAVFCKGFVKTNPPIEIAEIASAEKVPVLLVSLSKTYHPSYSPSQLAEMARQWWNLPRLGVKNFGLLRDSESAILAAWSSKFGGPQLVGLWRIEKNSFRPRTKDSRRFGMDVSDDNSLRRRWLGARLIGEGKSYQSPRISIP